MNHRHLAIWEGRERFLSLRLRRRSLLAPQHGFQARHRQFHLGLRSAIGGADNLMEGFQPVQSRIQSEAGVLP